jgi:hypothetical protein
MHPISTQLPRRQRDRPGPLHGKLGHPPEGALAAAALQLTHRCLSQLRVVSSLLLLHGSGRNLIEKVGFPVLCRIM